MQQDYRPIIALHKWFARRPGSLFYGLLLSEFSGKPLREVFYEANDLLGRHVADPWGVCPFWKPIVWDAMSRGLILTP